MQTRPNENRSSRTAVHRRVGGVSTGLVRDRWGLVVSTCFHALILLVLAWGKGVFDARSYESNLSADWVEPEIREVIDQSPSMADFSPSNGGGEGGLVPVTVASAQAEPVVELRADESIVLIGTERFLPVGDGLVESIAGKGLRQRVGAGRGVGLGNGDGTGLGSGLSFFDIPSLGSKFVFVLDCSGSMTEKQANGDCRLDLVKRELVAAIAGLGEEAQFYIIFFNTFSVGMEAKTLQPATLANKKRFLKWAVGRQGGGGTDPLPALSQAFELRPDVVYLLTDGQFETEVPGEIDRLNQSRVAVHTICLGDLRGEPGLKRIAERHSGTYRFVP